MVALRWMYIVAASFFVAMVGRVHGEGLRYDVRAGGELGWRRVAVQVSLDGEGEVALEMSRRLEPGHGVRGGYSFFLDAIRVFDEDGTLRRKVVHTEQKRLKLVVKQPAVVAYEVLLLHDRLYAQYGNDEWPYVCGGEKGGAFWNTAAMFLAPMDYEGDVQVVFDVSGDEDGTRLKGDDYSMVSTSWKQQDQMGDGEAGAVYFVDGAKKLVDSYVLLGPQRKREVVIKTGEGKGEEMAVRLASANLPAEGFEGIEEAMRRFSSGFLEMFGDAGQGRLLVVANRHAKVGQYDGGMTGNAISLLVGDSQEEDTRKQMYKFVGHEIFHLWNGGKFKSLPRENWFKEGVTEYMAWVVGVHEGIVTRSDFDERVKRAATGYKRQAGRISISDAGMNKSQNHGLIYDGGLLFGLKLDLWIMERTDGDAGLNLVMRRMFTRYGGEGLQWQRSDLMDVIEDVAGERPQRLMRRWLDSDMEMPIHEVLEVVGIKIGAKTGEVEKDVDEAGDRVVAWRYALGEMLGVSKCVRSEIGLIIHDSKMRGYEDGDVLVEVNGRAVHSGLDVGRALVGFEPGQRVEIVLLRAGEQVVKRKRLGGRKPVSYEVVSELGEAKKYLEKILGVED
ncbi:hypothetical protein [Poriferisphaera sp. WC338]|uniref:M61 family metallopeptidase n=1 Tax=Poriferisphaera sp. WC338 TaxID=3425129 RepID=UPI003D8133AF